MAKDSRRQRPDEAEGARQTAQHQETREQAKRAVADRNRKAHEAAREQRAARDKMRADMRKGLEL